MYDIIGDVHGHATLLKKLLKELGYVKTASGYAHSGRKAVFVGDFINRGPEIRQTVQLIRKMTEGGHAYALLGNHEVNAILYHLKDERKIPLLKKESKRAHTVVQTLQQFSKQPGEWKEHLKWMRSLPLFLDLGEIRIVHACWTDENIEILKNQLPEGKKAKSIFRNLVLDPKSSLSQSILQTTRGIHHILPPDIRIYDNRRRIHRFYRIRWWEEAAGLTFQQFSFESKFRLPEYSIPPEIMPEITPYPEEAPPVFFGHYCRGNGSLLIRNNLCCVDGCVMGKGRLVAYRWDGEKILNTDKLLIVK